MTVEQLDELRTLVNEVDVTSSGENGELPPLEVSARDTAPPVGSFLHRLALEF